MGSPSTEVLIFRYAVPHLHSLYFWIPLWTLIPLSRLSRRQLRGFPTYEYPLPWNASVYQDPNNLFGNSLGQCKITSWAPIWVLSSREGSSFLAPCLSSLSKPPSPHPFPPRFLCPGPGVPGRNMKTVSSFSKELKPINGNPFFKCLETALEGGWPSVKRDHLQVASTLSDLTVFME